MVVEIRAHVNDVCNTSNKLIHVRLARDSSPNGNPFSYEIERYAHGFILSLASVWHLPSKGKNASMPTTQ